MFQISSESILLFTYSLRIAHKSFQNTKVISTGFSDFHKMVVTVLKSTFKKAKPKEIVYRSYKNFDGDTFKYELRHELERSDECSVFEKNILEVLNKHAPLKKRVVCANEVPYMTKSLRKAIAIRSRLIVRRGFLPPPPPPPF